MTDAFIQLQPDGTGHKVDTTEITVGANTVERQRIQLGGSSAGNLVEPLGTAPVGAEYGMPVRNVPPTLSPNSPSGVSIGLSSTSVLSANSSRKGATIMNTSTATISFGLGAPAVLNSGITLVPGGCWTMDQYTFTQGSINAIASVAASNLSVQEFQ